MLMLCACASRDEGGVTVLVKVKCVYNSGEEARFESNTYQYAEVVIQKNVKDYVVGKYYYFEFRKK